MNRTFPFIFFFGLATFIAYGQQPVFTDFQVQQPAEPQGGLSALAQFMAINLRKPFLAEVANAKGLVVLRGVVEPDGHITEVSVLKSLRPDCDREAMRVFSLFNAWKPAQKDGKAVRQAVTIPVTIRKNDAVQYTGGKAIRYYNGAFQAIANPDSALLRSEVPTDTLGLPTGNLVFFERKGDKWKQNTEMEFFRYPLGKTGHFSVEHRDVNGKPFGRAYTVDSQGRIFTENQYNLDRKPTLMITRNSNQQVTSREVFGEKQSIRTAWHENGQIKSIVSHPLSQLPPGPASSVQMLAYWDSTGNQLVNEGNGQLVATERVKSMDNSDRYTIFTEQGLYEKGNRQGRWTGTYADGSYWYEEQYDNGALRKGKAYHTGRSDTLRYTVLEQQPEFKGGMPALSQFLASNIRYPSEAHRARAQGRVFVSFVINEDGSLSDFDVLKGVHPAADAEALRVIKAMDGRWQPGLQRGRPVRVKYNLPINFAIQ